jgi:hypothetical protein
LTEQVEDLLNTQEGNKSDTSNAINTTHDEVLNEITQELDSDELCSPPLLDKLATVVNKMLRTKLGEDKLKKKHCIPDHKIVKLWSLLELMRRSGQNCKVIPAQ